MARTHSSHTASPTRFRSPRRSPARLPSQDGSQYEMDLDALGLNSTFESTELDGIHEPPVDRVDTSEIEGPEDFTMNMTYWMTADLPLAQIKSRKEANARRSEIRMDAMREQDEPQDTTEEGDRAVAEDTASASATVRRNGTTDEREYSTPASERSMENDEKVRSFLSALPDTDMEGALTGTPLHMPKQNLLQVPRSSPPKARSLQPTVEDYDTPRKPTQETVIHHTLATVDRGEQDREQDQVAELHSRLEQQALASKTRITELETILSYTRSELDRARTDNYRHEERLAALEQSTKQQQRAEQEAARLAVQTQMKAREDALESKMQDFGEEMRLQNQAKLQNQRTEFERQLRTLQESKRLADEELETRGQTLEQVQAELIHLRQSEEERLGQVVEHKLEKDQATQVAPSEHDKVVQQLSSVQARADSLHAQLQAVTAEARATREDSQKKEAERMVAEDKNRSRTIRIADLESQLQTARFEVECAQTEVTAKQQLFQTNIDLNSEIRTLRSELDAARRKLASMDHNVSQSADLSRRMSSLQSQLESAQRDTASRDQQILDHIQSQEQLEQRFNTSQGRVDGLEKAVATLRQQLAVAHRDSAKVRTEIERSERDLEDANDRLQDSRAEADRRVLDVDKKLSKMKELKTEAELRFRELQGQHADLAEEHEAMLEDVRDKAEGAVRKAGAMLEQERSAKKRLINDLRRTKDEMTKLQDAAAQNVAEEESTDDDCATPISTATKAKDTEITNLRDIIKKQVAEMKTLKAEFNALKKENKSLKIASKDPSDRHITALENVISTLQNKNTDLESRLEAQEADFKAVNKALDEKVASMIRNIAKTIVTKRDGQWAETVDKVQSEKELLGKVLLRQWGREEVGIANETQGQRQEYAYKYVKRT